MFKCKPKDLECQKFLLISAIKKLQKYPNWKIIPIKVVKLEK